MNVGSYSVVESRMVSNCSVNAQKVVSRVIYEQWSSVCLPWMCWSLS